MSKKLETIKRYSYIIIAVLCLIAVCMIFAISVKPVSASGIKNKIDSGFYGYDVVFGFKEGSLYGLKFSFLALLAYLMAVGCIAISVVQFVRNLKNKKTIVILEYVLTAMLAICVILFILQFCFLNYSDNLVGTLFDYVNYRPAVGSIISCLCCLCSACLLITLEILQNKEHKLNEVMEILQNKNENDVSKEESKTAEKPTKNHTKDEKLKEQDKQNAENKNQKK